MTLINDVLLFILIDFVIFIMLRLFIRSFENYHYHKSVLRLYNIPKIVLRFFEHPAPMGSSSINTIKIRIQYALLYNTHPQL